MKDKKPSTQIPVIFQSIKEYEHEDSRFEKVRIWLMHTGQNLNGSSFSKQSVEVALPSLANTPILCFIEDNSSGEQDFSDHRMVLHRSENGDLNYKYLGQAIGVIPQDNNAHWRKRVADDGVEREYLVVDGLLWTKWDDPIDIMRRKKSTAHSMELHDDYTGFFDNNNVFHFETFKFFGACLLGDDVRPGMNSSSAELQFSKNEDIQKNVEMKLQEFYTLFSQEGGKEMPKENETPVVKDYEKTEVEFETTETTETEEVTEVEETQEDTTSDTPDNSTDSPDTFEEETPTEDTEEVVEKDEEAEDKPEETEEEVEPQVDYEAKFNELNGTHEQLKADYTSLQSQLSELQTYKRQREENDLKAKFEGKLSDEEFGQVFTELKEESLEKVEEKLFALIGKKNFSIQPTQKTNVNKVTILSPKEETYNPYGGIFD